jgi:putative N6-adenine-specific DNA methylase
MSEMVHGYIITPPGSEKALLLELESWKVDLDLDYKILETTKGGILLTTPLPQLLKLNHALKIPVRILLRLMSFKTRDFPRLYNKAESLPWQQYIRNPKPEWKVTTRASRLMHTDKIAETLDAALKNYLLHHPLKQKWLEQNLPPSTFFVRLEDDVLTLSLDLSGEPLYKRGFHVKKAEAPIRENLASWLLQELSLGLEGDLELIDPMCGSGTFLWEAVNLTQIITRPMAYQFTPFDQKLKMKSRSSSIQFKKLWGLDLDQTTLDFLNPTDEIEFKKHDLFLDPFIPEKSFKRLLICNPPYGMRIAAGKKQGFFEDLLEKIDLYKSDRSLVIIPEEAFTPTLNRWASRVISFSNGGISVKALIKI